MADSGSVAARLRRLRSAAGGVLASVRSAPVWSAAALQETLRSTRRRSNRDASPSLVEARDAAVEWLCRAQDIEDDGGFSRGYSLVHNSYLNGRGWQASYPETTGYIIPTFYALARELNRPELADRATRAARWESEIQLSSGGVVAGVVGQSNEPAFFNTGQVLLGWICAVRETDESILAESARTAAGFLAGSVEADGEWAGGDAPMARRDATLYNARTAWALAEAGSLFDSAQFTDAAARNLRTVVSAQRDNGWLPSCCLTDPEQPLLHTLAYALRGLLEGGRVLGDDAMIDAAGRGSSALAEQVSEDGWMAGRFRSDWSPAVGWSCLTGSAQMCSVWLRLAEVTGESRWTDPVERVLGFVASTQNRRTRRSGVRGGIAGSAPIWAEYGKYELLNWATKFFVDAVQRHLRRTASGESFLPRHLAALP